MAESDQNLLSIKQAARLLNVSEVSLRRWTNSGRLKCLRVGPRRERRFRRADLADFLESETAAPAEREALGPPVLLEDMAIRRGDHLCSLYGNDIGRLKLSVPLLADGLAKGETCFLIAAAAAREDILGHLAEVYPDCARARAQGRFILSDGQPTGAAMFADLEHRFVLAGRSGGVMLRLVGDMAWAPARGLDVADLMAFEARYNRELARRFPVVSLCQYDTRVFSGQGVHQALICHEDTFAYPLSRFV